MAREATRVQILLARLAFVLVMAFAVAGLLLYGMSGEVWNRVVGSIAARSGGPMTFRFIVQPVMAAGLAAIDGIRDARSGAPPYFWSLLAGSRQRVARLHDGVIATSRVILLGLGMDIIYQAIELDTFFPGEAAIVAVLLGFIPYLILRGPFARLAKLWIARETGPRAETPWTSRDVLKVPSREQSVVQYSAFQITVGSQKRDVANRYLSYFEALSPQG